MSKVARAQAFLEHWLLGLVLLVGASGLALPGPARTVVADHGIDVTLAVLVFATAIEVPAGALAALRRSATRLVAVVAVATAVLPILAWGASRLVGSVDLRHGVLVVGVAPAEVATVGIAAMAGGDVVVAAALLVASALVSVVLAGPILTLLGGASGGTGGVIGNLALVVGLPLAAGLVAGWWLRADAVRRRAGGAWRGQVAEGADVVSVVAILTLVYLVAAQVHLGWSYLVVVAALIVLVAASTVVGLMVGRLFGAAARQSILLHVSMRDFAVASGIASAAFGAASTGPLGVYGLLVITWGSAVAQVARRRHGPAATG